MDNAIQGERILKLVRAVLLLGLQDAKKGRTGAAYWLRDDTPRAYGYRWCCDLCELDPDRLRAGVRAYGGKFERKGGQQRKARGTRI